MTKLVSVDKNLMHIFEGLYPWNIKFALSNIVIGALIWSGNDWIPAGILTAKIEAGGFAIEWAYAEKEPDEVYSSMIAYILKQCRQIHGIEYIYCGVSDGNIGLKKALSECGFRFVEEEHYRDIHCLYGDIKDLRQYAGIRKLNVTSIYDIPSGTLIQFCNFLENKKGEHRIPLPIIPAEYDRESLVGYDENGIQSVILLKRHDDLLEIPWVYNADPTGKSFAVLIGTMQKKLDNILDSNARLVFGTCTLKAKNLVDYLIKNCRYTNVTLAFMEI